jgi:hypothetical protein
MVRGLEPVLPNRQQIVIPHDSRYPLVIDIPPLGPKLFCYSPVPVPPPMLNENVLNSGT